MAGTNYRLELESERFSAMLDRLVKGGANLKPLHDELGSELEESTRKRFKTKTAPSGTRWVDISEDWKKDKRDRGFNPGILTMRNDLANSPHWEATKEYVEIIAGPTEYAAIHQLGGQAGRGHKTTIPARPFIGLSAQDEANVRDALNDYLARIIRGD